MRSSASSSLIPNRISESVFFELFGFNREEERGPDTATFQTGLVYLVNSDLQFDARAARRLTDRGVDFLIGFGLSWRWEG